MIAYTLACSTVAIVGMPFRCWWHITEALYTTRPIPFSLLAAFDHREYGFSRGALLSNRRRQQQRQRSAFIRGVSEKGFLITLNTRWRRRPAVTTTTRYTKRHFGRHLINCIKVPFAIGFIQQQQQVKHQRSTWWCSSSPRHVTVVCLQMSPLTREMWCFSMKGNIIIVLEWQFLGWRGGQHGRSLTSVWYLYHRHVGVSVGTIRKGRAVDYEWACQSQKTTYGKEDRLLLQATLNQNQCLFKGYRLSFLGIRCGTCSYF